MVNCVGLDTEWKVILCLSVLAVLYIHYTCYTFVPDNPLQISESVNYLVLDLVENALLQLHPVGISNIKCRALSNKYFCLSTRAR